MATTSLDFSCNGQWQKVAGEGSVMVWGDDDFSAAMSGSAVTPSAGVVPLNADTMHTMSVLTGDALYVNGSPGQVLKVWRQTAP